MKDKSNYLKDIINKGLVLTLCNWEMPDTIHSLGFFAVKHLLKIIKEDEEKVISRVNDSFIPFITLKGFINLSGMFLKKFLEKEGIVPRVIILLADDIFLNFGEVKVSRANFHNQLKIKKIKHNGILNCIDFLGHLPIIIIRIGAYNTMKKISPIREYVLSKTPQTEIPKIQKIGENICKYIDKLTQDICDTKILEFEKNLTNVLGKNTIDPIPITFLSFRFLLSPS